MNVLNYCRCQPQRKIQNVRFGSGEFRADIKSYLDGSGRLADAHSRSNRRRGCRRRVGASFGLRPPRGRDFSAPRSNRDQSRAAARCRRHAAPASRGPSQHRQGTHIHFADNKWQRSQTVRLATLLFFHIIHNDNFIVVQLVPIHLFIVGNWSTLLWVF